MKHDLTKRQYKEMRKLNGIAWDREMETALSELENEFARWRKGDLDVYELNEQIHKFHDGISRDLYKQYILTRQLFGVYGAIARGIITEDEMSPELREAISEKIEQMRSY